MVLRHVMVVLLNLLLTITLPALYFAFILLKKIVSNVGNKCRKVINKGIIFFINSTFYKAKKIKPNFQIKIIYFILGDVLGNKFIIVKQDYTPSLQLSPPEAKPMLADVFIFCYVT